jgi:glycosyltransferase involved in cell wall biosynthesis
VLGVLLAGVPEGSILLLTDDAVAFAARRRGPKGARYIRLPSVGLHPLLARIPGLRGAWARFRLDDSVAKRAKHLRALFEVDRPRVCVGCTASPIDLPASYLASRACDIPFVAYLFDDPVQQWPDPYRRRAAVAWERQWAPDAAAVIAPNEVLAEDFGRRTGAPVSIVRNPAADEAFGPDTSQRPLGDPVRLVYTGAVYHAQFDAIRNLSAALRDVEFGARLDVYTGQNPSMLSGTDPRFVRTHAHVEGGEVFRLQQAADVLFLPLGFTTGVPELIRSAAPGKTAEYLASGRPILVHAPADSFVARFFREHDCGVVVDTPEPARLAGALARLRDDRSLRSRIVANAQRAAVGFSANESRRAFFDVLRLVAG